MSFLLIMNCTLSILMMFFKHPLSKGYMLLMLTISTALSASLSHLNAWFGYILFLIMIGGMLVAFIYMTSIASNEKFNFPKMKMLLALTLFITITIFIFQNQEYILTNSMSILSSQETNLNNSLFLSKLFSKPLSQLPLALMSYLLLTLIMVTKMTEFSKGPIRQK
nr:NADH dehydrogenase subunit 6 [Euwallacea similis]